MNTTFILITAAIGCAVLLINYAVWPVPVQSTSGAGIATLMGEHYEREGLAILRKELQYEQFAEPYEIPVKEGKKIVFHRMVDFAADTTALNEGLPPVSGGVLSAGGVSATVSAWGKFVAHSDFAASAPFAPIIKKAANGLTYWGALTYDTLIRNEINSYGTTTYGHARSALSDVSPKHSLSASEIRRVKLSLEREDVPPWKDGDYGAIVHPSVAYDMQGEITEGGWLDASKYAKPEQLLNGEIGRMLGVRFVKSTNVYWISAGTSNDAGTSADVYSCPFFGREAVGVVALAGQARAGTARKRNYRNFRVYLKGVGSAGARDPLDQFGTVGVKFATAVKVLEAKRVVICRVGSYQAPYA